MNVGAYWLSNMIYDIIKSLIPSAIVIGLVYAFNLKVRFKYNFIVLICLDLIFALSLWHNPIYLCDILFISGRRRSIDSNNFSALCNCRCWSHHCFVFKDIRKYAKSGR